MNVKIGRKMIELPNWRVTSTCLMLSFFTSINNGFISSVLNIPQYVVMNFVNQSYEVETGQPLQNMQESVLWSAVVTQRQVGQFIGTLMTPFITSRAGKKGMIMINSGILIVGLILQFTSEPTDVWPLLLAGRLIWGVGCGVIAVIIPMFLSEIAPQSYAGSLASLHGMALGFGSFVADFCGLRAILGSPRRWCYEYLVMVILQIIQVFIFGMICPESPKDLFIRQGKVDKAIKSLKFYQDPTQEELEQILQVYTAERHSTGKTSQFRRLFMDKRYRMSVLVGVGATCCYAFGSMQIITNYSTVLITHIGGSYKYASYVSLCIGISRFVAVFPSMYIVERFGRRPLLLASVGGCIISFFVFLIIYAVYGAYPNTSDSCVIGMTVFLLFYGFMFSIGCQTIGTFLPSEVVPTQERSANQGFAVMWRFIFAFVTTFIFYPLMTATNWGCWLELIIPLVLTGVFMWKYMPETKNKSANQVVAELNHEEYAGSTYGRLVDDDNPTALSDYGSIR